MNLEITPKTMLLLVLIKVMNINTHQEIDQYTYTFKSYFDLMYYKNRTRNFIFSDFLTTRLY